jgi:hypothetical protein
MSGDCEKIPPHPTLPERGPKPTARTRCSTCGLWCSPAGERGGCLCKRCPTCDGPDAGGAA